MQGILYKQARIDFLVGQIIEQNYYQKQAGMFSSAIGGARKALSVTAAKVGEIRNSVTAGVNKALFAKGEPTREVFKMGERRTVGGGIARENLPRTVTPTPTNSPAMFQAAQPRADFNVNSYKQDAKARIAQKNKHLSAATISAEINSPAHPSVENVFGGRNRSNTIQGQRPVSNVNTGITRNPVTAYKQQTGPISASSKGNTNTTANWVEQNAHEQMRGKRLNDIRATVERQNRGSELKARTRPGAITAPRNAFESPMSIQRAGDISESSRATSALRSASGDTVKRRALMSSYG